MGRVSILGHPLTPYASENNLELILLPPPTQCCSKGYELPHPVSVLLEIEHGLARVQQVLDQISTSPSLKLHFGERY